MDDLATYDEEFAANPRIFESDQEFPDSPARLGAVGYLREQRFVEVLFTPVIYNPSQRKARYFPRVRAEVLFTYPRGAEAVEATGPFAPDPLFEETYRRSLANYEQGKAYRVPSSQASPGATSTQTAPSVTSGTTPSAPRYKISLSRAGIYRLNHGFFLSNAPEILSFDPQTLVLRAEGTEIPIRVEGEGDGSFDAGDFLEFFGLPKREPPTVINYDFSSTFPDIYQANDFTDTQIYWLTSEGTPGTHLRTPTVRGDPINPGYALATDFEERAVWEENTVYWPLGDADPFFSSPSLLADSSQAQRDLSLALPGLASASSAATVTLRLRGVSSLSGAPDHRTRIWINGNQANGTEFDWDGEVIRETTLDIPHSALSNPVAIHVSAPGLPGVSVDEQYLDTVTIKYRRAFAAQADVLSFTYPNQDVRFQVSGFSGTDPIIYEISRSLSGSTEADPVRISGATVSGAAPRTYTFDVPADPTAPPVRSFVVAFSGGLTLPDSFALAPEPQLSDPQNAADILVIASRDAIDASPAGALQALLDHRLASQGLTSRVVFVDQVYEEFSYGLRDVNAIRSFIGYAFDNWKGSSGTARPPSFVLLVGDATPDYKNTLARSDWIDQVPTPIMFHINSILGHYSSDNWIASFRGADQVPDVHLGRISTRSAAAAAAVFDKIRRYEQSPPQGLWKGRALLVAGDGTFTGEADSFEAIQNAVAAAYFSTPPYSVPSSPLYFARLPWNSTDAAGFRNALISELNSGAVALSFIGHGSFETWGATTFFETQDAGALANGSLPFVLNVNCLAGGFHYLRAVGSLGEGLTNNPEGGAIAALAPAGLSSAFVGGLISDAVFWPFFGTTRERSVGAVGTGVRLSLWNQGGILELQSYTLLGDPATLLATPAPQPPTALMATAGNGEVTLSWSPSPEPVAGYRIYRAASTPTGTYSAVTCDPLSATSCVDRTVLNATTYYYYARAFDAEGFEGRASNFNSDCDGGPDCVVARPINPGPPSVPTGLLVTDAGSGGRLDVSWQANPERDISRYILHYGTFPGQYSVTLSYLKSTTSTTLSGLNDGVRYHFALSALNTSGHESGLSPGVSQVPHLIQGISPPRAISDLRLSHSGSDLVLTWSRPAVDIYGRPTTVIRYDIYRGTTPGFQPSPTTLRSTINDGSITIYTDSGSVDLPANLYYVVTATDSGGFVSGAGRDLPNGIQDLAVSLAASGSVHLAWSAVTTDVAGFPSLIDHYQIHRSSTPFRREDLGPSTIVMDNVQVLELDLPAPGSPVYISVVAVDNRGNLSPF